MRQKKKKSRLMAEGYKGLGVASLPLHDIATTYQSVEQVLELQQCSVTGAMIEFVIIPKIIGETDAMFDDTMSCQSGKQQAIRLGLPYFTRSNALCSIYFILSRTTLSSN